MKSKLSRYLSVLFGVLMIAGLIFGALSYKATAATPVVPAAIDETAAAMPVSALSQGWTPATRLWTAAEMAAAKPYPLQERSGERALSIEPLKGTGAPVMIPGAAPLGAKVETAAEADLAVFDGITPLGYSYPAPFTRFKNFANYNTFPYPTIGVLYFNQGGGSWRCSAASIGNYAIWTAGHCVHQGSGGAWSTNVVFLAEYRNGVALKGQWAAHDLISLNGWVNSGDLSYDSGGATLNLLNGYKISQKVGNLGFAYNGTDIYHWYAIGYPAESPFNGETQQVCAASFAYWDTSMSVPTKGIGCDQTGGTSGGPWIYKFSGAAGSTNYLNGNMSYRYSGYNNEIFSPYFGSGSYNLWYALINATL